MIENFTGKADLYSKHRPSYPKEYIENLLSGNQLSESSVIADIGSGTGILTKLLLEKKLYVIAIEPNDDMRRNAEMALNKYEKYKSINATAENTSLKNNSVDLITVAQAFHWFDKEKFKLECKRILKEGSKVSLVWNSKDLSSPIMIELQEICNETCPKFNGFSGGIEDTPDVYEQFFKDGIFEIKVYKNDLEMDLEGFLGRNMSSSFSPLRGEKEYETYRSALGNLFNKYSLNGKIVYPYITKSYLGHV
ncbi:class I SAM-dependent methyltransferase [Bacillus sp. AFS017336]|uniref:class I SAM-dependent methyltransferase n=1 Tax=Bacillus sp. AFS017336 TaxID=2033489 RepID=UPI000BF17EE0|nr:class I SAM-dependent methyltransferase [Bacillus sp. AFS017336]PEL12295.1 SAM-dependent methyltransferase [Bacillus sp. AFS017336]